MTHKTIIIAEAGVNHNGSRDLAIQLVRAAAAAGADFVKFQTFKADRLVAANAPKAQYQKENCPDGDNSQLAMLRRLELNQSDFEAIASECKKQGIGFMSTPFDEESVDMLAQLGMSYWKIPSGEITNLPLLRKIASAGGKIILSTGMSTPSEINDALNVLSAAGTPRSDITLLHCTTQYPAPLSSVNLLAIDALRQMGCGGVGYSDHTEGLLIPIAAAGLGVDVIEKHFTLDRALPGPDHKASLTPDELAQMVQEIRKVEMALGDGVKKVTDAERPNISVARKSIVASRHIKKGEILSPENLTCKRPANGLSPMLWDSVCGTKAVADFLPDQPIHL